MSQLTNHTLREALGVQLALLYGHLPLPGWVVGRGQDAGFTVLAAQGGWCSNADLRAVSRLLTGAWTTVSESASFEFRALSADEVITIGSLVSDIPIPDTLIRRPLTSSDGSVLGWLIGSAGQDSVCTMTQPDFSVDYVRQAVLTMGLCLSLYENFEKIQRQLTELQENAFTEPLTGVLNRAGWMNRVQHLEAIVARTDEDVAIIMLDLDLLKLVNDRQGHSAGDELLQLTAHTIQSAVRPSDVVGRLGGDEFGMAVRGISIDLAGALVCRMRAVLNRVGVNVSMGLALKSEAGSLDDALILADQRMYQEKRTKPVHADAMNWQRETMESSLGSRGVD